MNVAKCGSIRQSVLDFISESYLFGLEKAQLDDDQSLMETGVVDSTGILELVAFLESRFGIRVEDDEFIPENLDTLRNITAYVLRKTNGSE